MIFIGILLLLILFGGLGTATYVVLKKTDPENTEGVVPSKKVETADEFLPFKDIKDSMIHLGNHKYRMVLEVNSINYELKTNKEKHTIEMSYNQFLNSLMFPISIFIQTKEMDNTDYLNKLEKDYRESVEQFPQMAEYASHNFEDMRELNQMLGTTRQKKKFIIIHYDEANDFSKQTDAEKYESSLKELFSRARIIQDGLVNLGVQSEILKTQGILELMIATFHRDAYNFSEELYNKDYLSMIVEGEKEHFNNEIRDEVKVEQYVSEFKNALIHNVIENDYSDDETKRKANEIIKSLNSQMRENKDLFKDHVTSYEMNSEQEESVANVKEDDIEDDDDFFDDDVDDFTEKSETNNNQWQGVLK